MKFRNFFMVATVLLFAVTGCKQESTVTGIAISPESATLTEVGATTTLTAALAPSGTKADITWTSSNPEVATVVGDGLTATVTAVGNGTAKVTAKADIFTAEATITVNVGGGSSDTKSVKDLLDMKTDGTLPDKGAGTEKFWVEGYIVGTYNFSNTPQFIIGTANAVNTNLLLADAASTTDTYSVASVKLGDFASKLNLVDNPSNLGKKLKLYGVVEKYCGIGGVVNIEKAYIDGVEVVLDGLDDVTVTDNMTCQAAYDAAASLKSGAQSSAAATVYGYVTSIKYAYDSTYENISFYMNDTQGGADLFYAYRVKGTAAATIKVGDKVKVTAKLTNYNGNTPETVSGGAVEIVN